MIKSTAAAGPYSEGQKVQVIGAEAIKAFRAEVEPFGLGWCSVCFLVQPLRELTTRTGKRKGICRGCEEMG
jgi:hypothetical protein